MFGSSFAASDPMAFPIVGAIGTFNGYTDVSGRTQVHPALVAGEDTAVIIFLGQSNSTNAGFPAPFYTPANARLHNLNIFSGGVYQAKEPLLGGGGTGSAASTVAGDTLITDAYYERVILVPFGIGGSLASQWAAGGNCNERINVAARRLASVGLTATFICWHQGESDALAGTSQVSYQASLSSMIATCRSAGFTCPIFISKASWISGSVPAGGAAVRAAQAAVVDNGANIFAGPDSDVLDNTHRSGGTDFTTSGMAALAALWVTVLKNYDDTH